MAEFFNNDKSWDTLSQECHYAAKQITDGLVNGVDKYNEWQSFRAGRTNADIATAIGRTETEVAEMDAAYSAMLAIHNYADNQTPSQSDYFFSLRKFS